MTKIVVQCSQCSSLRGRQKAQSDIRYQVFTDTGSVDIAWSWCQHTTDNSREKVLDIKPNTWLQTNKKCKVALKIFLVSKYRPYIHISNSILFCIFIVTVPISWSNSLRMGIEKKTVFILMPGWDLGFTWDLWRWLGWRRQSSRVVSKECRGGSLMVDFVQL